MYLGCIPEISREKRKKGITVCGYSYLAQFSRLATGDENLVLHQLAYCKGFATVEEVRAAEQWKPTPVTRWQAFCNWWSPKIEKKCPLVYAICIPPGALLEVTGFSLSLRTFYQVRETELVTFTQVDLELEHTHHDALLFSNGKIVKLQSLHTGLQARILSLEGISERIMHGDAVSSTTPTALSRQ